MGRRFIGGRSPSARTLEYYKLLGYEVANVEIQIGPLKKDAFGFIDILVFNEIETIGVQTSSGVNHGTKIKDLASNPLVVKFLKNRDRRVHVCTWSGVSAPSGRGKFFTPRRERFYIDEGSGLLKTERIRENETDIHLLWQSEALRRARTRAQTKLRNNSNRTESVSPSNDGEQAKTND